MAGPTVYFARAGTDGPIKIGYTGGDPLVRLAELQTGCPWRLTLIGHVAGNTRQEAWLQSRFDSIKLEGEWFEPTAEILAAVQEVLSPGFIWPTLFVGKSGGKAHIVTPMENIRRNVFGVSQSVFAAIAGTTQPTVSRWETGEFCPNYSDMQRVRQAAFDRGMNWSDALFFEVPAAGATLWAVG